MLSNEEKKVKEILQNFVKENIPEYILEISEELIAQNGVQKVTLKKRDQYWDIEGHVQGDDFQMYNSEIGLNLEGESVNFYCNCPESFSGICKHIGATVLKFLSSLSEDSQDAIPKARTDWRHNFHHFFATELEPEPGQHYLVYRFFPEYGRLQVEFFRARQNKSGLSTVLNPITLEQIIRNPNWCEVSPSLPKVAEQIGQYLDYYGHRVEIPYGLLTWFFWTIRDEYYLFFEETEQPVRVLSTPMRLQLRPTLSEDGLSFEIMLGREGKLPFSITGEKVFFYGQLPLWVYWKHCFYPVQTGLPPSLIQELAVEPPIVPHSEISEFLDRVWTKIHASDLFGQEEFLERMSPIFVQAKYNPKLFLDEEGSLLTLQIQNIYETEHGEITLSGPDQDLQTGSYQFEGKSFLIRRDQAKEGELLSKLVDIGFQARSNSMWFLEPEEAINFLLDHYPQLIKEYRVFGEQNLTRYKVRLSPPNVVAKVETKEEDKWFNLDIVVEYEDIQVPIEKIWKAWTQGKRYVQLKDGSYTSLPESWLKKLGHKLQAMGFDPEKPPKKKFHNHEAPILDKIIEDIDDVQADSFWTELREKIHSFTEIKQVSPPKGLNATLRPYQLQGLSYLNFLREYKFGGILADEMGLGKTIQTLSFLQYMKEKGLKGPNLIIVPTSVLPNWEREAQKFVPDMKRLVIYGARRENMFKKIKDSELVMTTYALLRRDLDELIKHEYNSIILDEAQNIKNPNTITARSVRKLEAKFRLCLSGTPIENNLLELWSLFEFLMPGFLGSQHAFQKGFVKPIKDGDQETLEYLRARVKPFILRRTKSEVAKDLPPKVENVYYSALLDEQMELYAALAKKLKEQVMQRVDEKGIAGSQMSILDALLKLRQICCHPRLLKLDMPGVNTNIPSGKFEAFKDLVTNIIEDGHKVLVFSQFVQMLHIIRSWLNMNKIPFAYLDGSSKDRFEQVDRFNNNPNIPIFLISLKAGGTGLNLTSADYVIHYDPWWNPAVENQATDRTHRIGQTKQVFAYKMICENTVEEKILKLQEQKRGVAEAIIPGQSAWKSLTRDDLEMLFEV
ncbi:DEAD/DEAH box helicase [Desulfohalobiaceae bacterium Ax17]|uniref:DEAD/DEAH box helicase n=1 Tax=Desulfovulcanus ferrireducens TaxID=2831190 RepID=UPI00207BC4AD|nr:DEAD/DEAH box helicase [Desulfovulcanus ferrireducens]MBT8763751.1 DEAD/DEAH box helicase [Desulfovulcanus ferrireducens]